MSSLFASLRRLSFALAFAFACVFACGSMVPLLAACGDNRCGRSAGPIEGVANVLVQDADYRGVLNVSDRGVLSRGTFGDGTVLADFDGSAEGGDAASADAGVRAPAPDATCTALVYGTASDDGKAPLVLAVRCSKGSDATFVELALPDARPLSQGETKAAGMRVVTTRAGAACTFSARRGATVTVTQAVGARAPSPTFVTPDLVRGLRIDVDVQAVDLVGEDAPGTSAAGCSPPEALAVRGDLVLRASDYMQASRSGACDDVGPPLPNVGKTF